MSQMEYNLLGQNYTLGCPPGCEQMLRIAVQLVEEELATIQNAGRVKARERMAILAALNLAYRLAEQSVAPPPTPEELLEGQMTDRAIIDTLIQRIDNVLAIPSVTIPPPVPVTPPSDEPQHLHDELPTLTSTWTPPA